MNSRVPQKAMRVSASHAGPSGATGRTGPPASSRQNTVRVARWDRRSQGPVDRRLGRVSSLRRGLACRKRCRVKKVLPRYREYS